MLAHHYLSALDLARSAGQDTSELAERARVALGEAGDRALALNAFRQAVGFLRGEFEFSERRACTVLGFRRSSCRYVARRTMVQGLLDDIRAHAAARPRFGYRRIHVLLRRGGWRVLPAQSLHRLERLTVTSRPC